MSFGKQAEGGRLLRQPTSAQTPFFTILTLRPQDAISLVFYSARVGIICTDPQVVASAWGFSASSHLRTCSCVPRSC